jgi:peptide/nickel transport system ATP-binding protein
MSLLDVRDLVVQFRGERRSDPVIRAVAGVSLTLERGQTLGIVGESGCGKSSLGKGILRLVQPNSGTIDFDGADVMAAGDRELRGLRQRMQMVFQDPRSSLDPRKSIGSALTEPLRVHGLASGAAARELAADTLKLVELSPQMMNQYPHELSGGQLQRISIARAVIMHPDLIVADEPVSALDVSVQAQIINLLEELQRSLGMAYVFISHDLAIVHHISDVVAVMYLGTIVEHAEVAQLFAAPQHPYTLSLLSAVPVADPAVAMQHRPLLLTGDLPSPANPPTGCRFHTRCPYRQPTRCADEVPVLAPGSGSSHAVACHFAREIRTGEITAAAPAVIEGGADRSGTTTT